MNFLEVQNVSKRFGGLQAVDALSFHVAKGEIVSIIGPNGAGKSTLFKIIAGAMKPSAGEILFDGKRITGRPQHVAARLGVVRTFQETTIFRNLTALEHIVIAHHLQVRSSLAATFLGTWRAEMEERKINDNALRILTYLGLDAWRGEPAKNLPHGHLRALGIGMALGADPKLLLLDEPFAGMNPEETNKAVGLVRGLRDQGITILLVEHDMRAVMRISDRIVAVSFGHKVAEGKPHEIQDSPAVIESYLGRQDDELGV